MTEAERKQAAQTALLSFHKLKDNMTPTSTASEADISPPDRRGPPELKVVPKLPPLSIKEWLGRDDLSEPDFLMGSWLTTTSRVLLTATTGLGKTNFSMALAVRAAAGLKFLHWGGRRKARVLYVDGEMSRRLYRDRIRSECKRAGCEPETMYFLSSEDIENMPPLNTPAGQAWMDKFITDIGGVDLIIFDNIMSLLIGEMKDPEMWQKALSWALSLTKRSIAQIWIHHTGHDATRSYGDKTKEWQMDTTVHLDAVKHADTDVSFAVKFVKARERAPATRDDFREVNVSLINDEWLHGAGSPKATSKGTTVFDDALNAALIDHGFDHRIMKGATVRAVELELIRPEFDVRYLYTGGDKDPHKIAEAKRKAFGRALQDAQRAKAIGVEAKGRKQLVWFTGAGK